MAKQDDYIKTALRLPPALHVSLTASAAERGHSLNAEMVARLQRSYETHLDNDTAKVLQSLLAASEHQERLIKTQQKLLMKTGAMMAAALALAPSPTDDTGKALHAISRKYAEAIAQDDLTEAAGAMYELIAYGQGHDWYDENGQLTPQARRLIERKKQPHNSPKK